MIMVKMNNTTVECSIAASELRELGLTPEAVVNEDKKSFPFMAQLGREVGEQLGYDPETEVLMITKNLMGDGSLRIFAMKMTDQDIEESTEKMRATAAKILKLTSRRRMESIKNKTGKEKGIALNKLMGDISTAMAEVYGQAAESIAEPQLEALSRRLASMERYMVKFDSLEECVRFARAVSHFPVGESSLYKEKDKYFMIVGMLSDGSALSYEIRCLCLEYAKDLQMGSPELTHIEETAECLIKNDAVKNLMVFNGEAEG